MSKTKVSKVSSKNNPEGRGQTKEYLYKKKKVKPVKLILKKRSYLGAEYEESGDLVISNDGSPLPWRDVKREC